MNKLISAILILTAAISLSSCNSGSQAQRELQAVPPSPSQATPMKIVTTGGVKTITDLEAWSHPAKAVFEKHRIPLDKVELLDNETYPVFYISLPSDRKLTNEDWRSLSREVAEANGYWDFHIVDTSGAAEIKVTNDRSRREITGIELNKHPLFQKQGADPFNLHNGGFATEDKSSIYYVNGYTGFLYKSDKLTGKTALLSTGIVFPRQLNVWNEWLYYLDANSGYIYKVRTDGTDNQAFIKEKCSELYINGDGVYFIGEDGTVQLIQTDLSGRKQITKDRASDLSVQGKAISYLNRQGSYITMLENGWTGSEDIPVWTQGHDSFSLNKGYLYYHQASGSKDEIVSSVSIEQFVTDDQSVYYLSGNKSGTVYTVDAGNPKPRELGLSCAAINIIGTTIYCPGRSYYSGASEPYDSFTAYHTTDGSITNLVDPSLNTGEQNDQAMMTLIQAHPALTKEELEHSFNSFSKDIDGFLRPGTKSLGLFIADVNGDQTKEWIWVHTRIVDGKAAMYASLFGWHGQEAAKLDEIRLDHFDHYIKNISVGDIIPGDHAEILIADSSEYPAYVLLSLKDGQFTVEDPGKIGLEQHPQSIGIDMDTSKLYTGSRITTGLWSIHNYEWKNGQFVYIDSTELHTDEPGF